MSGTEAVFVLLFWLVVGHVICDFALQTDFVAIQKNHLLAATERKMPWQIALGAHAIIHGAAVAFILQSVTLGIAETIVHFCIDYNKSDKSFGIWTDQILHIVCKFWWLILLGLGIY